LILDILSFIKYIDLIKERLVLVKVARSSCVVVTGTMELMQGF
jgi:hypothetical protein